MSADPEERAAVESTARDIAERHRDAANDSAARTRMWADYAAAGLVATGGLGDAGDDWFEYACAVVRGAYRGQVSIPLVDTALARLIFGSRLPAEAAGAAIVFADPPAAVPWADSVRFAVIRGPADDSWILAPAAACAARVRVDPWGQPVADLQVSGVTPAAECCVPAELVLSYARIAVAAAMAGTMTAMVDRTVRYAKEREQFGRPLWAFQAIKHQIVVAAELAKVAERASIVTADVSRSAVPPLTALLVKSAAGTAATTVAQVAHHVHGALGMTDEYALSHLTRQLFWLRDRFGSEHECLQSLGAGLAAADRAGTDLWESITTL